MQARGPAVDNRKLCTNQEDIAELRPVTQIPRQRFVSCAQPRGTRGDAVIYGLDVSSAQGLIVRRLPWPWDRGAIPHSFRAAVIVLCRELGVISRVEGSTIRRRAARACDSDRAVERLHSALNAAGHVVDPEWFSGMTLAASFRFLHELRQVWEHRVGIDDEQRALLCPPDGDLFRELRNAPRPVPPAMVERQVLSLSERLVTGSSDQALRELGALYVVGCLTLVYPRAANAFPWLAASFAYARA